jgi:hypothetical protein
MDNFRVIYRILKRLEAAMDCDELLTDAFTPQALGVSQQRLNSIFTMMQDDGYLSGVSVVKAWGQGIVALNIDHMAITIKGLEYLHENSIMKKMADAAKGIIELIK